MNPDPPVNSLFQQPWWLDAVAPGRWDAVQIKGDGGELLAWMPYVVRLDKWGLKVIDMPQLTMTLGPWISEPRAEAPRRRLGHYLSLLGELADALPEADLVRQRFDSSVPTALPFKQRGYTVETAYTYRFNDLTDEDQVWTAMSSDRRRQIKKAAKQVAVEPTDDLDVFLRLNRMTFDRQGMTPPYSDDYVRRIDHACRANDCREILVAKDEAGNVHAASYEVFDETTTYNLMSGYDPQYHHFGSGSLLTWEKIRRTVKRSKAFDFEGGTSPNVAAFVGTFGAELVPYSVVIKESLRWRTLELARAQGAAGASMASSMSVGMRKRFGGRRHPE